MLQKININCHCRDRFTLVFVVITIFFGAAGLVEIESIFFCEKSGRSGVHCRNVMSGGLYYNEG